MATYEPTAVPYDSPPGLRAWLLAQLKKIASALAAPTVLKLEFVVLHAEPARISDGDVVFADGSDWDPGSGGGLYERVSGSWEKL